MPLLYAVIARGTTVLAKYAFVAGNFSEVADQILTKISPGESKLTYTHGNYLFHYILEDGIVYLCITDDEFERSRAFLFLNDVKKRFQTTYGERAQTAVAFAMNTDFARVLANQMKHYSESREFDTVSRVQNELDELKDIMVKNIDNIAARGERLELLITKTDNLSSTSVQFRKSSRNLARAMFWKNVKIVVTIAIVLVIVLYLIISMACGGLTWGSCVN